MFLGNVKMEIRFIQKVEWYVYLDKEERQFVEEIKQEMHLNMEQQYGGFYLW